MQDYKYIRSMRERREGEIMQNKGVAISGDKNSMFSLSSLHFLIPHTFSIMDV